MAGLKDFRGSSLISPNIDEGKRADEELGTQSRSRSRTPSPNNIDDTHQYKNKNQQMRGPDTFGDLYEQRMAAMYPRQRESSSFQ